jgi:hypothetical protein
MEFEIKRNEELIYNTSILNKDFENLKIDEIDVISDKESKKLISK